MKRFGACMSDGNFINVFADRMEIKENMVYVYQGDSLVAFADMGCVLHAKLEDVQMKEDKKQGEKI